MQIKYIVFDLDETLGNFIQLGIFIDSLEKILGYKLNQQQFNEICMMFPNFFRPELFRLFHRVLQKKQNNTKIIIYTNNNGEKDWTIKIATFIETILNAKIFDQIIGCYKTSEGKQIEANRTTYHKTPKDLRKCLGCDNTAKFIFFDDQQHPYMVDNTITYIRLKPYIYVYNFMYMTDLFLISPLANNMQIINAPIFKSILLFHMNKYNYQEKYPTKQMLEIDRIITMQMYKDINKFLQ